jgi:methionyl aminopeptidase
MIRGVFLLNRLERNDKCWCNSGRKYKQCHYDFDEKLLTYKRSGYTVPSREIIKNEAQIYGIRESGKVNIEVLNYVSDNIKVGMTTEEIDRLVYEKTLQLGGTPATLGFEGFPKSVCTSLNNEVCHGIPSDKVILKEGNIINVDVSTILNGYFSDSSRMFCIGNVSDENMRLVQVAKKAIGVGLDEVKSWNCLGNIGQVINDFVRANGYSVVREIGGHGVGLELHEDLFVSYVSKRDTDMLMVPGMVFTIEPMINAGSSDIVCDEENGWTVYTKDGMFSAQWEVTVAVTEHGYEILAY